MEVVLLPTSFKKGTWRGMGRDAHPCTPVIHPWPIKSLIGHMMQEFSHYAFERFIQYALEKSFFKRQKFLQYVLDGFFFYIMCSFFFHLIIEQNRTE